MSVYKNLHLLRAEIRWGEEDEQIVFAGASRSVWIELNGVCVCVAESLSFTVLLFCCCCRPAASSYPVWFEVIEFSIQWKKLSFPLNDLQAQKAQFSQIILVIFVCFELDGNMNVSLNFGFLEVGWSEPAGVDLAILCELNWTILFTHFSRLWQWCACWGSICANSWSFYCLSKLISVAVINRAMHLTSPHRRSFPLSVPIYNLLRKHIQPF